jgi:hypothetical protein
MKQMTPPALIEVRNQTKGILEREPNLVFDITN